MSLRDAIEGTEYIIRDIDSDDEELKAFLFSLGCYSGEPITVVTRKKSSCVVSIKDARYTIDMELAAAILIQDNMMVNQFTIYFWEVVSDHYLGLDN